MKPVAPIFITDLFPQVHVELLALLKSLGDEDWDRPTVARAWSVKDIAREYTERWHHQQQIREVVGAPGLTNRKWLHPVLDTFFRGLPHTYRNVVVNDGTLISFEVVGEAGGEWTLAKENETWRLYAGGSTNSACHVRINQDTAWRLMTKGISRDQSASQIEIVGEKTLGTPILGMLAVMA